MTTNTLKALYEHGRHHVENYRPLKGHLLILGEKPKLVISGFDGEAPLSFYRTSGIKANLGHDSRKYVLVPGSERFNTFWSKQLEVFPQHKDLLLKTREALEADTLSVEGEDKNKPEDWFFLALPDKTALVSEPSFRRWWDDNVADLQSETLPLECHCWVTGEVCKPLRVHSKAVGVPSADKSSITAFQYSEYGLQGQIHSASQGANFPLSPKAGRAIAAGLQYALAGEGIYAIQLPSFNGKPRDANRIVGVIPEGAESPFLLKYLPLFRRYTSNEDADPLWSDLDNETPSEAKVHLVFFKGAKGRIAILDQFEATEGFLLERLLKLRGMSKDPANPKSRSQTLVRLLEDSDHRPLIPHIHQSQAVWDFLTGRPFSKVVLTSIATRSQHTPVHMARVRQLIGDSNV